MPDKLPLWKNVRWFQLVFGAFVAIVGYQLYAEDMSTGGKVLRVAGLAFGSLIFVIYLQNVYRFGLVPDYSKKCWNCNGPVNRYSEFCEHCGADLISPEKLIACPKCGLDSMEGTKHCPECGARLPQPYHGKKKKPKVEPEEGLGWDTPIDATTGIPPPKRRGGED